jgi:hypothetical protein
LVELGTLRETTRDFAFLFVPIHAAHELLAREQLLEATVLWNEPRSRATEAVGRCQVDGQFLELTLRR